MGREGRCNQVEDHKCQAEEVEFCPAPFGREPVKKVLWLVEAELCTKWARETIGPAESIGGTNTPRETCW